MHKALTTATPETEVAKAMVDAGISATELEAKKILLVGSSAAAVDLVHRKDAVLEIRKKREKVATKPHPESRVHRTYTFGEVKPLREFRDSEEARKLLIRLREDIGVIEVMRKRQWYIAMLTELHPGEKEILGFNMNKGAEISLRLRTDDLSGFRHYKTIVQVLMHELAHMVWSEHDENFHALNRVLNKEYDSFSTGRVTGMQGRVDGSKEFTGDDGNTSQSYQTGVYVLGGGASSSSDPRIEVNKSEVLAAAEKRALRKWEEDILHDCKGRNK